MQIHVRRATIYFYRSRNGEKKKKKKKRKTKHLVEAKKEDPGSAPFSLRRGEFFLPHVHGAIIDARDAT